MAGRKKRNITQKIAIDIAGFSLLIISPFLGPLPGPGAIPIFVAGLGILSLNYDWAANLLKDFERRRVHFVEKYLVNHKIISRSIDIFGSLIIISSIIFILNTESDLLRTAYIMLISISVVLILSNQKRIDRMMDWYRKKRDKNKIPKK